MAELHTHPQISHTHTFLKAENISAHYGDTAALMNLTLHIPANRLTVLIGPSGCGKSTLLRCFNGLVKISSGRIDYEDESIRSLSETDLRRNMGYVIQSIGLMPHMTVEENVDLVPRLLGWDRASRKERATRLLQLVRLDPDWRSTVASYKIVSNSFIYIKLLTICHTSHCMPIFKGVFKST